MCKNEQTNLFEQLFLESSMRVSLLNRQSAHWRLMVHWCSPLMVPFPELGSHSWALSPNETIWMLQRRVGFIAQCVCVFKYCSCVKYLCVNKEQRKLWLQTYIFPIFQHHAMWSVFIIVLSLHSQPTYKWDAESMWNWYFIFIYVILYRNDF